MKNISKDNIIKIMVGIIIMQLGILFYVLSSKLPEWMCGMLLAGGIILYVLYCMVR